MYQSQQQTQATDIWEEEIRLSIYLLYFEGASEKLQHIHRSHKIRSTFYTERTLHKLLCKPKERVATEDKTILSIITITSLAGDIVPCCDDITIIYGLWN